ncbi:MAG: hypothetical protein V4463_25210 [Pseudomonadota bacterium]
MKLIHGIPVTIPTALYLAVQAHRRTYSNLTMQEVFIQALEDWMAHTRAAAHAVTDASRNGYQWKCLFLPDGSHLRARSGKSGLCAEVKGNRIIFQGLPMSPHQFTRAECGPGRNAWSTLMVRLAGQDRWHTACSLRKELLGSSAVPAPTPTQAMMEASQAMAAALREALVLVENAQRSRRRAH